MTGTTPDMERMGRQRRERLRSAMADNDIAMLLLAGGRNVEYASGSPASVDDAEVARRSDRLLLVDGDGATQLLDATIDGASAPVMGAVSDAVTGRDRVRLGIDEGTVPLFDALRQLSSIELVDAGVVMRDARARKTVDEVACIRTAQRINEAAIDALRAGAVPGVGERQLSERFIELVLDLGAGASLVDPVWQSITGEWPRTRYGQPAYPAPPHDHILVDGDVLWVDTGVGYGGYSSDLGRTWPIGASSHFRHDDQFRRWREITDAVLATVAAGARGSDLVAAARSIDGSPWLRHLYLAHGLGMNSSEHPLVGTVNTAADDVVLEAGMVLVVEPVVWSEEGRGYRAEEVVLVTDGGYEMLSRNIADPDV
jgi:Xaa-Pro dipeptidase